jgi:hypothetical protein
MGAESGRRKPTASRAAAIWNDGSQGLRPLRPENDLAGRGIHGLPGLIGKASLCAPCAHMSAETSSLWEERSGTQIYSI